MSRIEKTAAVTLLLSFLLFCGAMIRSYTISRRASQSVLPEVKIGEILNLPGVGPGAAHSTLVLVITSQCSYCVEALPFYRRLAEMSVASAGDLRLIAAMPENSNDARAFLQHAGVGIDSVLSISPRRVGARIFPTLLLLDQNGRLQKYWVGELHDDEQQQVISTLGQYCATCRLPRADLRISPSGKSGSTQALSIHLLSIPTINRG
jgi:hypothetical protein